MGCGSSVARPADSKAASTHAALKPSEVAPQQQQQQQPTGAAPGPPTKPPSPPGPGGSSRPASARPTSPATSSGPGSGPTQAAAPSLPPNTSSQSPRPAVSRPESSTTTTTTTPQEAAPAPSSPSLVAANELTPPQQQPQQQPQTESQQRATDLTTILAQRLLEQQRQKQEEGEEQEEEQQQRTTKRTQSSGSGGDGGLGDEVEALLGGAERFQDLMRDLMATHTQVLLPGDANPEDAATLQAVSGCTMDQAVRLLDCLAVVRAAADALVPSDPTAGPARSNPDSAAEATADEPGSSSGTAPPPPKEAAAAVGVAAAGADVSKAAAASGPAVTTATAAAAMSPSPQQLTRQLGALSGLVNDVSGLRTAAMARDAASSLLRVLLHHPERAAAANSALVLAALATGPPPHKNSLIAAGVVDGLLRAARGLTAAAEANGGDAPGVVANACSALGNLVTGHPAGAAAVAGGGGAAGFAGVDTLVALLAVEHAPNVRTNAAGVLVQLTGVHESYRAALAAAGGVPALAAGMLRGPDAPACNAATALYNLAALTPPSLRPALAQATGPFAIVPQLLLCMSGRNASGAGDESVAAAAAARVNASAVLLELCKDPTAAAALAAPTLAVPAALAALTAGRLPPPAAAAAAADILTGGVDLLYPVPPVVRGNCLLGLMALARMGPGMQLELGRCGALGALLELLEPGQDTAMQVNSANAICALAAANADIHSALVAARCVPLLAGLLMKGGDAARANVAAVCVTMMRDPDARQQMQECGALTSLVRLAAALLDERLAAGISGGGGGGGGSSSDPGGVLCNTVGALAEAAKHPELRRGLLQVEFGESLSTLLRCLKEAPEPAQVNAAAALCHLCREQPAAVQLGRLRGVELLKEAAGGHPEEEGEAEDPFPVSSSAARPSSRLRHNASRALARLQQQLTAAEEEEQAATAARAVGRVAAAATAGDGAVPPATALSGSIHADAGGSGGDDDKGDAGGGAGGRREPPRAVWDLGDAAAAAAPPLASSSKTFDEVLSYEDDADDLSTVITPPLPLAAF